MRNVTLNMTPLPAHHQQKAVPYPLLASLLQPHVQAKKGRERCCFFQGKILAAREGYQGPSQLGKEQNLRCCRPLIFFPSH